LFGPTIEFLPSLVGQIKALCVDVGWFAAPEQAQISVKARALKK
jgi:hypothetical protein